LSRVLSLSLAALLAQPILEPPQTRRLEETVPISGVLAANQTERWILDVPSGKLMEVLVEGPGRDRGGKPSPHSDFCG